MKNQNNNDKFTTSIREGKLSILEHFWKYSADNMFIMVLDEDNDFVVEDFNPAQLQNFDFDPSLSCGVKLKHMIEEQVYNNVEARYRQCLEQDTPLVYDETLIVEGKTRYWNTMIIPVADSADGKIRIFGISRELTTLINTKNALATLNAELEETIASRTHELQLSNAKLKEQAFTDTLTQIGNRRYFFQHAEELYNSARQRGLPVSIIYLDMDDFKNLNDSYGHLAGDAVLRKLAARLKNAIRQSDILGRFGGEEFVILLPFTDSKIAAERAGDILEIISETPFVFEGHPLKVTSSIGVATILPADNNNLKTLIKQADSALYNAKGKGKNRVELY